MFKINDDKSIYVTRGDAISIALSVQANGEAYTLKEGDVVRMKVFEKSGCDCVVLQKDITVKEQTYEVTILLDDKDTKIGGIISKPKDYWYEIELNPETQPQTIIGYDEDGAKVFRLFPEGGDEI